MTQQKYWNNAFNIRKTEMENQIKVEVKGWEQKWSDLFLGFNLLKRTCWSWRWVENEIYFHCFFFSFHQFIYSSRRTNLDWPQIDHIDRRFEACFKVNYSKKKNEAIFYSWVYKYWNSLQICTIGAGFANTLICVAVGRQDFFEFHQNTFSFHRRQPMPLKERGRVKGIIVWRLFWILKFEFTLVPSTDGVIGPRSCWAAGFSCCTKQN